MPEEGVWGGDAPPRGAPPHTHVVTAQLPLAQLS